MRVRDRSALCLRGIVGGILGNEGILSDRVGALQAQNVRIALSQGVGPDRLGRNVRFISGQLESNVLFVAAEPPTKRPFHAAFFAGYLRGGGGGWVALRTKEHRRSRSDGAGISVQSVACSLPSLTA